jgi:hypothetical protein
MLFHVPGAAAEVRVTETGSGALVVEAHHATVQEVIEALRAARAIDFRSKETLSRTITGTYSGTLEHVLARILDGYDRVIRSTASGLQLDIVGPEAGAGGAPRPVAQTMQPGPPALRPSPVPPQQPRMVRGYLDLDGELSQ